MHYALQKHSFYLPKGHLLPTKSIAFTFQKHNFCGVKPYVPKMPDYQSTANVYFLCSLQSDYLLSVKQFHL